MFKNELFPSSVSEGISWGGGWSVDVVVEGGGDEQRNQNWSLPLHTAEGVAKACKDEATRNDLVDFVWVVAGITYSFPVRNHANYIVAAGQGLFDAVGDGTYQFVKRHTRGAFTADQDISLPQQGTIVVYAVGSPTVQLTEGVHYSINYTSGILTPIGSPTLIPGTWTGYFYLRCRFRGLEGIRFEALTLEVFRAQVLGLQEVRYEEPAA